MKTSIKPKYLQFRALSGLLLGAGLLAGVAIPVQGLAASNQSHSHPLQARRVAMAQQPAAQRAKIQLAILLDTSGSMSGLIDQTRNQLWQVVNEYAKARHNGLSPILQVAVYEYGNSRLEAGDGYVRRVTELTSELDRVSEGLYSLTTTGGQEYCGYVIQTAVTDLQWSAAENDIRVLFIAGNEPFTQGPVHFQQAIEAAKAKGIVVNTIHAGNHEQGAQTGWQQGALLAGGNYMSIDHNHKVVHFEAPQDKRIAELNKQLNQTYVPYGEQGAEGAQRQQEQDAQSGDISLGLLAKRAKSKASSLYNNSAWDLIDALNSGSVSLESVEEEALPAPMQAMTKAEQKQFVEEAAEKRNRIQNEIAELAEARDDYVAQKKREVAEANPSTIDEAMISSVREQGKTKGFVFQE